MPSGNVLIYRECNSQGYRSDTTLGKLNAVTKVISEYNSNLFTRPTPNSLILGLDEG